MTPLDLIPDPERESRIRRAIPEQVRKANARDARLAKAADGPRYKALGNSMAVPVMRWVGERIAQVEAIGRAEVAA